MASLTHIAGSVIHLAGPRTIQRCALCGMKLVDDLHQPSGVTPTWEIGRLIRSTEGQPDVMLPSGDDLPLDSCLQLVEDT